MPETPSQMKRLEIKDQSIDQVNTNDPLTRAEKLAQIKPETKAFLDLWKKITSSKNGKKEIRGLSTINNSHENFVYQTYKWKTLSLTIGIHWDSNSGDNYFDSQWKYIDPTRTWWTTKLLLLVDGRIEMTITKIKENGAFVDLNDDGSSKTETFVLSGDEAKQFLLDTKSKFEQRLKSGAQTIIQKAKKFSQNSIDQNELNELEQKALNA